MHLSADLQTQTPEAEAEAEREQMFVQRFQWVACAKIRLRFEFQVEQLNNSKNLLINKNMTGFYV